MRLFVTVVIAFFAHTQWVCTESTSELVGVESATVAATLDENAETTPLFTTLQATNPTEAIPESGDVRVLQDVQQTAAEAMNKLVDLENPPPATQVLHFILCLNTTFVYRWFLYSVKV